MGPGIVRSGKDRYRKMPASLAAVMFVSVALSSLAAWLCLIFAGAGEAAASPGLTYFAPLWACRELAPLEAGQYSSYTNWAFLFMFVYYCIYGLGLGVARMKRRGKLGLSAVLIFHYAGVAVCLSSSSWDGMQNIWIVSHLYGAWISVVLVEYFVILHVAAFQYACSEPPYRPKLTPRTLLVLTVGLAAGVGFHLLAMRQAPADIVG